MTSLVFHSIYKSIQQFDKVDIPDFTVITGLNGSGKSHLLKAIENGSVIADGVVPAEIRFYDGAALSPQDSATINISEVRSHANNIVSWVRAAEQTVEKGLNHIIAQSGLRHVTAVDLLKLKEAELFDLFDASLDASKAQLVREVIQYQKQFTSALRSHYGRDPQWDEIFKLIVTRLNKYNIAGISIEEMNKLPHGWQSQNLFQQSFGQMFFSYFDKHRANRFQKMDYEEGKTKQPPLTEKEFIQTHGKAPWLFVNELLETARLPYKITYPEEAMAETYTPILVDNKNGNEIRFGDLSSGEKILMSFSISLYYTSHKRQSYHKPKILLFDEIDAPLHPSMSRQLIDIISNNIVKGEGVKVIMTTHSPSTIAMCPEESIHLMVRAKGLRKTTKNQAIAELTSGIPTLSINFDGRIQVFTEDAKDAARLERTYQIYKARLMSEKTLTFIPIGRTGQGTTGCAQVRTIVSSLRSAGCQSVFGVVDWDKKYSSDENVIVMSEGMHYSAENWLYDPLLIAAAVLIEQPSYATSLGLMDGTTFIGFPLQSVSTLQNVSSIIQSIITKNSSPTVKPVTYLANFDLKVDESYLEMNGHDLEVEIIKAFPCLNRYAVGGKLMDTIIEKILPNVPDFLPFSVYNTFNMLLQGRALETNEDIKKLKQT